MNKRTLLSLPPLSLNLLSGGFAIFLVLLGIKVLRASNIALEVANSRLVTGNSADKLQELAQQLDEQAQIIRRKDEALFVPEGKAIAGELSFMPNGMTAALAPDALSGMVRQNSQVTIVEPTGKLPAYSPPKAYTGRSGGGYNRGASSEEKVAFLKKQMVADIRDTAFKEEHTLISMVKQIIAENPMDERFLDTYFELLMAVTSSVPRKF